MAFDTVSRLHFRFAKPTYFVFIRVEGRGELVLRLSEMGRKLETEEEKVLPFYASSLSQEEQEDVEVGRDVCVMNDYKNYGSFFQTGQVLQRVEHAPLRHVGWVRFPVGSYRRFAKTLYAACVVCERVQGKAFTALPVTCHQSCIKYERSLVDPYPEKAEVYHRSLLTLRWEYKASMTKHLLFLFSMFMSLFL